MIVYLKSRSRDPSNLIVVGVLAPFGEKSAHRNRLCVVPFEGGARNGDFSCRGDSVQPLHICVVRNRMEFLDGATGAF